MELSLKRPPAHCDRAIKTGKSNAKRRDCDPAYLPKGMVRTVKSPGSSTFHGAGGDQSQSARWWSQWEAGLCARREKQITVHKDSDQAKNARKRKARRCGAGLNGHIQGVRVTSYRYRASIAATAGLVCRGFVRTLLQVVIGPTQYMGANPVLARPGHPEQRPARLALMH